jgi:hypothetical protein
MADFYVQMSRFTSLGVIHGDIVNEVGEMILGGLCKFLVGGRMIMPFCRKCGRKLSGDDNYCPTCGTAVGIVEEVFSVSSDDLVHRVKGLIHEGNVTRIIVKNENDETLLEIPVTVGVIGIVLAPWVAALGCIAALATRCTIVVQRKSEETD